MPPKLGENARSKTIRRYLGRCEHAPLCDRPGRRPDPVFLLPDNRRETIASPDALPGSPLCDVPRIGHNSIPADRGRVSASTSEPSQLASPDRSLQGAREHFFESEIPQPPAQTLRIEFAALSERQICEASMLAREAPRGLAVPCKANDRKDAAHGLAPSASSSRHVRRKELNSEHFGLRHLYRQRRQGPCAHPPTGSATSSEKQRPIPLAL